MQVYQSSNTMCEKACAEVFDEGPSGGVDVGDASIEGGGNYTKPPAQTEVADWKSDGRNLSFAYELGKLWI